MSAKAPPFHQINGRRLMFQKNVAETPEQEVLRFIQESWKNVCKEIEISKGLPEGRAPSVAYYKDGLSDDHVPRPGCKFHVQSTFFATRRSTSPLGFKPFDLDSFLEKRAVYLNSNKKLTQ